LSGSKIHIDKSSYSTVSQRRLVTQANFGNLLLALLLCGAARAQSISVYPATVSSPIGGYPTCSSQIVGQNDKTATWSTTGGTIIGVNPSVANEPSIVALFTMTPGSYTLTATSNTGAMTAHCTVTFTAETTPVTTHPRMGGLTAAGMTALRAKAVSGNTLYNSGVYSIATNLYTGVNAIWNWSCGGGAGNTKTGQPTSDQSQSYELGGNYEAVAMFFAFMANVDPADGTYNWGCYARDLWNYYQNYWLSPDNSQYTAVSAPYRATDENYGLTGNHGSDNTTSLTMTPDWLLGAGFLGAGSGATLAPGSFLTASITGNATINTNTITSVSVTGGTPQVGLTITNANFPAGTLITNITGSTYTVSQVATASATASSMTVSGFLPSISAAGSGYSASGNVYWYMYGGGCATQGHYGNFESTGISGNNGIAYVAMGVAQTNSSGQVSGNVTPLTNATGCSTAPTIAVYSDQNSARSYLTMAGSMMINIAYTGVRAAVGGYNSSAQFDTASIYDFQGQRAMGNNYTHSKIMYLTAAALTFNDNTTDDPTLPQTSNTNTCNGSRPTVCSDGSVSNMHAFWGYLTEGMLYKDWAHLEDPNVTWQAYEAAYSNLPTEPMCDDSVNTINAPSRGPCFGDGREGQSSEGTSYGYSFYRLAEAMLSIHSAGYDDPILYGPQMSLGVSSFFDLHANADLEFLSYNFVASQPRYQTFFVGDIFNFPNPSTFEDNAWLMVYDASVGRTDRTATLEWPLVATSVGGPSAFYANLANSYGGDNSIPMFMALPSGDPSTSYPSDPRPTLPLVTYSANNQSVFARSAWDTTGPISPSNTGSPPASTQQVFFSRCANTRIDHEPGDCGRFDIESNAEYISKARAIAPEYNYYFSSAEHAGLFGLGANSAQTACLPDSGEEFIAPLCQGMTNWSAQSYTTESIVATYSNLFWQCTGNPCLSTDVPGTAGDWASVSSSATRGAGQIFHALQAGNATLIHSEMRNYVAFHVDETNLYCTTYVTAVGIGSIAPCPTAASRSLVYLRGSKQVVWYDRGAGASNSRDWVETTGPITISGNTASWPTQSGTQKAYMTTLLTGITMSDAGGYLTNANGYSGTPDWEAYSHVLEDLGTPSSAQVLNTLTWGATGFSYSTPNLVQSTAGQNYDCAEITVSQVCFMRAWPTMFTGTTVSVAGPVSTLYVSDTTPSTPYGIVGTGCTEPTVTSDVGGVLVLSGCSGNVTIGTASSTPPVQTFGAQQIFGGQVIQ
jgi:hypothetical protein